MKIKEVKMKEIDVVEKIKSALAERDLYVMKSFQASRVQLTEHKDPVYYNRKPDSVSRYAHSKRECGVLYLAISPELAVAESFQHGQSGPGTPVSVKEIEERSLHQVETTRELKLVDLGRLAAFSGLKPRDLIQAKGQGSEGYILTQTISTVCMEYSIEIDGLIYNSSVYDPASTSAGSNFVLFEERATQVVPVGATPLMEALLPNGETAIEFLVSLNLIVE